ncbi:hypothetical protein BDC45DRAFT_518549 [Circinella umbellata]|nr:hypothetical protein BDC45DRAFT_518549 [Circinella umbellata]
MRKTKKGHPPTERIWFVAVMCIIHLCISDTYTFSMFYITRLLVCVIICYYYYL